MRSKNCIFSSTSITPILSVEKHYCYVSKRQIKSKNPSIFLDRIIYEDPSNFNFLVLNRIAKDSPQKIICASVNKLSNLESENKNDYILHNMP